MLCQGSRVSDTGLEHHGVAVLCRLHDAHHSQVLSVFCQIPDIRLITGPVRPHLILTVIDIVIRTVYQFKGCSDHVIVGVGSHTLRRVYIFFIQKLLDHLIQFQGIPQPQRVEQHIADAAPLGQDYHTLIVVFRPSPCLHVILALIKGGVFRHLVKHICAHHGGHHTAGTGGRAKPESVKRVVRVYLAHLAVVYLIDLRRHIVAVFHCVCVVLNTAFTALKILFQRLQVIGVHPGKRICHHLDDVHLPGPSLTSSSRVHHRREVNSRALDLQRILRERLLLHILDIIIDPSREGQYKSNTDDADRSRKRGKDGAGLFRPQIVETERQSREK